MGPLSIKYRTALIFYLVFAGVLALVTFYNPATIVSGNLAAPSVGAAKQGRLVDLTPLHGELAETWLEQLGKLGLKPEPVYHSQITSLKETKVGSTAIKYIFADSRLEIPPREATKIDLIDLAAEWKSVYGSRGLAVKIKWSYRDHRLQGRLQSRATVAVSGRLKELLVEQLIVEQLLNEDQLKALKLDRLWPATPPEVPDKPGVLERILEKTPKKQPRVAIIIDDVGFVQKPADAMLKVPARLTWAVLPLTPYGVEYAEAAKEKGFEVILHLPLEPLGGEQANPGPGLIRRSWSEAEIDRQLEENLSSVPGAVGLNNHMGSAGTADERLMDTLMKVIKRKKLFFIDSFTNFKSVAGKYARQHQVPYNKRQVFIDHSSDYGSKKAALRQLIRIALKEGEAIGIGHVRPGTAEAIIEILPEFSKAGIEIVPVSELVK